MARRSHPLREVLWKVRSFQFGQRVEANGKWWFDNRPREAQGTVILQYIVEGGMVYEDAQGRSDVPAGSAALFVMGEASSYGVPRGHCDVMRTNFLGLEGAGLVAHVNDLRERYGSVFRLGANNPLLKTMHDLAERSNPRNSAEACLHASEVYRFLMRLHAWVEEHHARARPPVDRAVDELLRHPTNPWSLKEVAVRHGCSREHLTRVFVERIGTPPATYLARAKVAKALELLRETRLPVEQVARQSGFVSKHTLARWVRRETGRAPGHYRQHAVPYVAT